MRCCITLYYKHLWCVMWCVVSEGQTYPSIDGSGRQEQAGAYIDPILLVHWDGVCLLFFFFFFFVSA